MLFLSIESHLITYLVKLEIPMAVCLCFWPRVSKSELCIKIHTGSLLIYQPIYTSRLFLPFWCCFCLNDAYKLLGL